MMDMRVLRCLSLILSLAFATVLKAERCEPEERCAAEKTSRPISFIFSLEAGGEQLIDQYLSPLEYSGTMAGMHFRWLKAMPASPDKLRMHFDVDLHSAFTGNPARNARIYDWQLRFAWGMRRMWRLPSAFHLQIGGAAELQGGALYSTRNGNNPVSARASLGIALEASLSRPVRIGRIPVLLSEEVSLPSASLFFAPQYGEPYYEIYLGNHNGLLHAGWWGNNFRLRNRLCADIDFGGWALRVGYRLLVDSRSVCGNASRRVGNAIEIGIIPGGIGLAPKKKHSNAGQRIINAIY